MPGDDTNKEGGNTETLLGAKPGASDAGNAGDQNKAGDAGNVGDQNKGGEEAKDKGDTKQEDTKKDERYGAPEKYEAFKLPEGVEAPQTYVDKFTAFAKKYNLSQTGAQEAVDMYLEIEKDAAGSIDKVWKETHARWRSEVENDKEIGGNNMKQTMEYISVVKASRLMTPELQQAIELTGVGNNPAFVKFFRNLGKTMSEDKLVSGGKGGGGNDANDPDARAKRIFKNYN
jgi:hypothetical protein